MKYLLIALLAPSLVFAQKGKAPQKPGNEEEYYKILTFTTPPGEVLESGAIEIMPDGFEP